MHMLYFHRFYGLLAFHILLGLQLCDAAVITPEVTKGELGFVNLWSPHASVTSSLWSAMQVILRKFWWGLFLQNAELQCVERQECVL